MNRKLNSVISEIVAHIPEAEQDLRLKLHDVQNSLNYSPPESEYMWWNVVGEILREHVFSNAVNYNTLADYRYHLIKSNEYWKEKVRQIWVGEKDV